MQRRSLPRNTNLLSRTIPKRNYLQLLFLAVFLVQLSLGEVASAQVKSAATPDEIYLDFQPLTVDCAPRALLFALKYGNQDLQSVYAQLSGDHMEGKVDFVIAKWGKSTSRVAGRKRFQKGMYALDILDLSNDVMGEFKQAEVVHHSTTRHPLESDEECVHRIHKWINESLDKGFPPIALIDHFVASKVSSEESVEWKSKCAHAVAITKVPDSLRGNQTGFAFEFVESDDIVSDGYICFENVRNYPPLVPTSKILERSYPIVAGMSGLQIEEIAPSDRNLVMIRSIIGRFPEGLKKWKQNPPR